MAKDCNLSPEEDSALTMADFKVSSSSALQAITPSSFYRMLVLGGFLLAMTLSLLEGSRYLIALGTINPAPSQSGSTDRS